MESNVTMPVNLGNPEEFNMKEFAVIIRDLVGKYFIFYSIKSVKIVCFANLIKLYNFRKQQ